MLCVCCSSVYALATPAEKTVLTLAVCTSSSQVDEIVKEFNNTSESYTIEIIKFDNATDINELLASVIDGSGLDMFWIEEGKLDQNELSDYCVELLQYLDLDDDYSRETLIPSLLSAISDQGLYFLPVDFQIYTWYVEGSTPYINGEFTVERAKAMIQEQGIEMFSYGAMSREAVAEKIALTLSSIYTSGVDVDSYELLQELKKIPITYDESAEKNGLLHFISVGGNLENIGAVSRKTEGDYCFTGLPGIAGSGSAFIIENQVGIFTSCSDVDGAWAFVRTVLSENVQETTTYLPSTSVWLQARLEESIRYDIVTQEDVTKVSELIDSVSAAAAFGTESYNTTLSAINQIIA